MKSFVAKQKHLPTVKFHILSKHFGYGFGKAPKKDYKKFLDVAKTLLNVLEKRYNNEKIQLINKELPMDGIDEVLEALRKDSTKISNQYKSLRELFSGVRKYFSNYHFLQEVPAFSAVFHAYAVKKFQGIVSCITLDNLCSLQDFGTNLDELRNRALNVYKSLIKFKRISRKEDNHVQKFLEDLKVDNDVAQIVDWYEKNVVKKINDYVKLHNQLRQQQKKVRRQIVKEDSMYPIVGVSKFKHRFKKIHGIEDFLQEEKYISTEEYWRQWVKHFSDTVFDNPLSYFCYFPIRIFVLCLEKILDWVPYCFEDVKGRGVVSERGLLSAKNSVDDVLKNYPSFKVKDNNQNENGDRQYDTTKFNRAKKIEDLLEKIEKIKKKQEKQNRQRVEEEKQRRNERYKEEFPYRNARMELGRLCVSIKIFGTFKPFKRFHVQDDSKVCFYFTVNLGRNQKKHFNKAWQELRGSIAQLSWLFCDYDTQQKHIVFRVQKKDLNKLKEQKKFLEFTLFRSQQMIPQNSFKLPKEGKFHKQNKSHFSKDVGEYKDKSDYVMEKKKRENKDNMSKGSTVKIKPGGWHNFPHHRMFVGKEKLERGGKSLFGGNRFPISKNINSKTTNSIVDVTGDFSSSYEMAWYFVELCNQKRQSFLLGSKNRILLEGLRDKVFHHYAAVDFDALSKVMQKIASGEMKGLSVLDILYDDPKKCLDWLYRQLHNAIEECYKLFIERKDPALDRLEKVLMRTREACEIHKGRCFSDIRTKTLEVVDQKLQELANDENDDWQMVLSVVPEFSAELKKAMQQEPYDLSDLKAAGMPAVEELAQDLQLHMEEKSNVKQIVMCLSLISVVVRGDKQYNKQAWYKKATKLRHKEVMVEPSQFIELAKTALESLQLSQPNLNDSKFLIV